MQEFVLRALRRASLRWPARTKVKQAARVGRNRYECAKCKAIVPNKAISIDHVAPCVDPETGFVDWNSYVVRLFVPEEGLQALCKACHAAKSKAENERRKEVKAANKQKEKKPRRRKPTKANKSKAGPPR